MASVGGVLGTTLGKRLGTDLAPSSTSIPGTDPTTVANLDLDWNPHTPGAVSLGATMTFTDDASGNVRSQATALLQPSLVTADPNFNGYNSLLYASGTRYMVDTAPASRMAYLHSAAWTIFIVGRITAPGAINASVHTFIATGDNGAPSRGVRVNPIQIAVSNGVTNNLNTGLIGHGLTGQQSFYACMSWTGVVGANTFKYKTSGMAAWGSTSSANAIDPSDPAGQCYYGANIIPSRNLAGSEARILIYNAVVPEADRDGIITHLVAKYVLTA
jgi:hypothetical protein